MNKPEVVDVLSALASGVHPVTGEVFAETSPYNHPKVIRALYGSLEIIQSSAGRGPKKSQEEINREEGRPLRSNMRWSEEEDRELISLIEQGILTGDIATKFERTKGAIHSRLQRQGLLEREELVNSLDEEILSLVQERVASSKKDAATASA